MLVDITDITGEKFNKLTVVCFSHNLKNSSNNRKVFWLCKCECYNFHLVNTNNLISNKSKSCGCLRNQKLVDRSRKHGRSKTPEYETWMSLKRRCYNKNFERYQDYGGRGIVMSDDWKDSFESFLVDMGRRPSSEHSIDRLDVDGDYCFENCSWKTNKEQCNNKRNNRVLEYNGESLTVTQWAEKLGLSLRTILSRIRYNWSVERILTQAPRKLKRVNND